MIQLFYPFIEERSWMLLDFFLSVIRIQLRLCFQFLIPRWAKEITLKEPQQRTKQEIHSIVQLMKQLKGFRRYSFKIQEAICAALKYDWYDKKQPLKFRVLFVRRKKIWILTLKNYCWVYSSLDASHGIMSCPLCEFFIVQTACTMNVFYLNYSFTTLRGNQICFLKH